MNFNWKFEKVLKIKRLQEDSLKARLAKVAQQEMSLQSQTMLLNAAIRSDLLSVREIPLQDRLEKQQSALKDCNYKRRQIDKITMQINKLQKEKENIKSDIMKARQYREGLEKLKEKDRKDFVADFNKKEQMEIDEVISTKFARKIIHEQNYSMR